MWNNKSIITTSMEDKPTKIIYGTNIEHQENHFDVHDFTINGGNFYLNDLVKKPASSDDKDPLDGQDRQVVEKMMCAFKQDEQHAIAFLNFVKTASPTQITQRVTQLIEEGIIEKGEAKSHLWNILHNAGLYTLSRQNWDNQVKIKY